MNHAPEVDVHQPVRASASVMPWTDEASETPALLITTSAAPPFDVPCHRIHRLRVGDDVEAVGHRLPGRSAACIAPRRGLVDVRKNELRAGCREAPSASPMPDAAPVTTTRRRSAAWWAGASGPRRAPSMRST